MKKVKLLGLLFILIITSCRIDKHELLIETESFSEKGGWVVDPQFVVQMGSPYLLAHGLGNPVGQMGVATGYAASLCIKYKTGPRGVYNSHIKELLSLIEDR